MLRGRDHAHRRVSAPEIVEGLQVLEHRVRELDPCLPALAVVHRCPIYKRRDILEHLPEHRYASADRNLREAWDLKPPGFTGDAGVS